MIVHRIQQNLREIEKIIRNYYRVENPEAGEDDINKYVALGFTPGEKSKNTGAIKGTHKNITEVLNNDDANIRELFSMIDEIGHHFCAPMSWMLFVVFCDDSLSPRYKLDMTVFDENIFIDKLIFCSDVIFGSKQNYKNDLPKLKKYI